MKKYFAVLCKDGSVHNNSIDTNELCQLEWCRVTNDYKFPCGPHRVVNLSEAKNERVDEESDPQRWIAEAKKRFRAAEDDADFKASVTAKLRDELKVRSERVAALEAVARLLHSYFDTRDAREFFALHDALAALDKLEVKP